MIIIAFFLVVLLLLKPHFSRYVQLKRFERAFELPTHRRALRDLFQSVNGFALSHQARIEHDAFEYTYGEIEFTSWIALLTLTCPTHTTRFIDLGSGIGKAVIAAAMVFDMQHYCGVEVLKPLHEAAIVSQNALLHSQRYAQKASKITFIFNHFLSVDLRLETLIFINATAFIGEIWEALNQKIAREVRTNAIIITTTKPLKTARFKPVRITKVKMNFGIVNAYVHACILDELKSLE